MSNNKKKILLGLTTTSGSNWREKIEEIKKYNIQDIALFLTGIQKKEREELYYLLEKTKIDFIYHIHIRSDMAEKELEYLVKRYKVQALNIHSWRSRFAFPNFPTRFKKITYIENTAVVPTFQELNQFAGVCIDFSHWDVHKFFHWKEYQRMKRVVKQYPIGCCHVSAVRYFKKIRISFDKHKARRQQEFDYLKKYKNYLPQYISLELENSFQEQLVYKKYIESFLN